MRAYAPLDGPKRDISADRVKSAAVLQNKRGGTKTAVTSSYLAPSKAWTVDSVYNNSSALLGRTGLKADSPVRAQGKQMPSNGTGDLVVTSARIVSIRMK